MNFILVHLKMNGGSNKKNEEQKKSITRRRETGFEVSLKQEAVMKTSFEDKVEGNKITRGRKIILNSWEYQKRGRLSAKGKKKKGSRP